MLSTTASQLALINEAVTKPIYLIDLQFPNQEYLSTNGDQVARVFVSQGDTIIDGPEILYSGGEIGLSAAADWATASVRVPASAARMQALITGDWRGNPAKIYLLPAIDYPMRIEAGYVADGYARQGFVVDDLILLLDGIITGASGDSGSITIDITHASRIGKWAPRIRLMPPICNWLPASGTRLTWAGEIFVLEAR